MVKAIRPNYGESVPYDDVMDVPHVMQRRKEECCAKEAIELQTILQKAIGTNDDDDED